ncbi:type II-A CRISPR-associated protein Csn2 [Vagococcus sp.]|uniref:type II-A CRISPR-associated protein Csn2 n=1 Tax=Vagococcus sp. TaxID=1933889 RepID=UPI003F981F8A
MTKFNFPLLDEPVDLKEINCLVIEEIELFSKIVKELYQYEEKSELKIFNEAYKPLKALELLLVTDIMGFEVNSAPILKLIYEDLKEELNEKPETKTKIEQLALKISQLIEQEILEHELDLELDEITILELFKALGIKIETQSDTLYEKMFEIIQIFKYLSKKKVLVFVNVCSYFPMDELKEIMNYISLMNIEVLFLEPRKINGVSQAIIDKDYYLTVKNML